MRGELYQSIFDDSTATARFSMSSLYSSLMSALAGTPDIALINNIITALGPSIGKYVIESVLRASFFI